MLLVKKGAIGRNMQAPYRILKRVCVYSFLGEGVLNAQETWFYLDRVVGGHRHHRTSDVNPHAGHAQGQAAGQHDQLPGQSKAVESHGGHVHREQRRQVLEIGRRYAGLLVPAVHGRQGQGLEDQQDLVLPISNQADH